MRLLQYSHTELADKLSKYLANDQSYKLVFDFAKRRFDEATDLTAHNWAHAYRDTLNAIVIGEAEKADMHIVLPAITMHDIGFLYGATGATHGAVGAERLQEFLKDAHTDYTADELSEIAACIRTHKGSMHNEKPESLEAKVVADADLIEKFGPIGIYQTIRTFTEFNWPLEKLVERLNDNTTLTFETKTGKNLAEPGMQFIDNFFKELREASESYL